MLISNFWGIEILISLKYGEYNVYKKSDRKQSDQK